MNKDRCRCISCNKELQNVMDSNNGFQPIKGTAFQSYGHYGSTFFDPMNGTYIEIVVCDECLTTKKDLIHGNYKQ